MSIKGIFPIEKWDFKTASILTDMPANDLELLNRHKSEQQYKKGEIIFREGAYPTGIFYIKTGKVKKYKAGPGNREQIIYIADAGELIGYHAILAGERYPDSAASLENSIIAFIPKEDFIAALEQSPALGSRLLKTLSHEFAVLINNMTLFSQKSVRERLALQLVVLREKYKTGARPGEPVEINMSRDDLASLVGSARENVVRVLAEFKDEKLVTTKGRKIIVLDVNKLISIANYT
jgi:CRP-like cAMP-binding protein